MSVTNRLWLLWLQAGLRMVELFEDLRDGHNLISLLEVLAHDILPRERGHMRFHKIQNVQIALDFLRLKGIRLVNIRSDEIVDGNPKLTLGLVWTIILHFQVGRRGRLFVCLSDLDVRLFVSEQARVFV
ncbi:alpha-actinin-4-like [Littorina saxatilis]|uniref:alpha-actinin-4-like n=1 Tax=Littorina saxatilis TaxID=31220 RepID=UPI0038B61B6A